MRTSCSRLVLSALFLLVLAAGCANGSTSTPGTGATGGTAGGGGVIAATGGAGGGAGLSLPLIVDDHSGPQSCYGKAAVAGAVTQTPDATDCLAASPSHAGKCWRIDYHPTVTVGDGGDTFGGCQWSLDPNATAALTIQPGATQAIFTAAGLAGGEVINFFAGGTPSDRATFVAQKITLTKTLTDYQIQIPDLTAKTQIHVPFGYTIVDGDNTGAAQSFFVTGIEWVK